MHERAAEAFPIGVVLEVIGFLRQTLNPLQRQPGMYRIGAAADQAGDIVFKARHPGVSHQADLRAQASPIQRLVHTADSQQHIEPRLVDIETTIGENDDATALLNRLTGFPSELVQAPLGTFRALIGRIGHRQRGDALLVAQPGEAGSTENGVLQFDDFGIVLPENRFGGEIAVELAEGDPRREHIGFIVRIDGRIGDLGMPASGVARQGPWSFDHQRRDRRIVPHGEGGFFAGAQHGEDEILTLVAVGAEGDQQPGEAIGIDR